MTTGHRLRLAAAVTAVIALLPFAATGPVEATQPEPATQSAHRGDGVRKAVKSWHQLSGGQVYLKTVRMCARWTFNANWKVKIAIDNNQDIWSFENPQISNPDLWVRFYKNCSSDTVRKVSRFTAKTYLAASNFSLRLCSMNPSISIGAPWQISVGVAPTCSDDTDRASRTRSIEPRDPQPGFHVASTGRTALWDKFEWYHNESVSHDRAQRACFSLRVYLDVQNAAGTAIDDATDSPVTPHFCLPVGSWAVALAGR